jgi:hypothetical protein
MTEVVNMFQDIFRNFVKFMEFTRNLLRGIHHNRMVSQKERTEPSWKWHTVC